jgi:hypothetical protein
VTNPQTTEQHALVPLTFSEAVAVDNYKAAMSGAFSAADSVADKVVTASVSIATAYGAVIALVAPKDTPAPWQAALPFVAMAAAVGTALYAQSLGISIAPTDKVNDVLARITSTINSKRVWGRRALYALVAALIIAGYVIYEYYGPSAEEDETPAQVTLYLSSAGTKAVSLACGRKNLTSLRGEVKDVSNLSEARVSLEVSESQCPSGAGVVELSQRAITGVKRSPP